MQTGSPNAWSPGRHAHAGWSAGWISLLLFVSLFSGAQAVLAHGKSLKIGLSSSVTGPLEKTYAVTVRYADDQDPVPGASVAFQAGKAGAKPETTGPVTLRPEGAAGTYVGKVRFPSPGTWAARLEVAGRNGKGFATFVETIGPAAAAGQDRPVSRRTSPEAVNLPEASGSITVSLGLGLGDVLDLSMRVAHIIAAIVWIGGLAFLLLVLRPMLGENSTRRSNARLAEAYRRFGNVAGVSLALLVGTGAYNVVFNAPNPGGILNLKTLGDHPFGYTWLEILGLKVALVAAMVGVAAFMRLRLVPLLTRRISPNPGPEHAAEQAHRSRLVLKQLSTANLILGCLVVLLATAMAYVHLVGHASVPGAEIIG